MLFLTFAIIGATIFLIYYFRNKIELTSLANDNLDNQIDNVDEGVYEEKINIYSGNTRPIAVSIDNERAAWPHSGLQDAYMIYEMIIEGGETRLLAFFQNKDTSKVGPIRSTRHYFVHYVMEHNAIFAHFGWSPKAEEYIKKYNVNGEGLQDYTNPIDGLKDGDIVYAYSEDANGNVAWNGITIIVVEKGTLNSDEGE